ncbi:MAG: PQQ-like beta-propeller repeat protein [Aureliella sp.]
MKLLARLSHTLLLLSAVLVASGTSAKLCFADDQDTGSAPKRSFLTADSSKKRIAIIGEDGEVKWEHKIGPLHDLHMLPSGNILFQRSWTDIVEINPANNKIVWQYDSSTGDNAGRKVEVHAFQRLANGRTMIVESGASRIIEVDATGKKVFEMPLLVSKPHPHRDTRLARKLDDGNYLVCHEGDGRVREYRAKAAGDSAKSDGIKIAKPEVIWDYEVPMFGRKPQNGHGVEAFGNQCFCALRLANGNTLISTGNGHSVIEVTPAKEIVWKLAQDELPGIQLAWVTTLQQLPGGNIVVGNCHAGESNPQIIEVNRDKQVVWSFHDFKRFGNATTNTQVLTVDGEKLSL